MSSVVKIDPEIHSGDPCFNGTRVPVAILFEYLLHGYTTKYFLSQYPGVSADQVRQLLREGLQHAVECAERVEATTA